MAIRDLLKKKDDQEAHEDLGFGAKVAQKGERLINKDGSFNIVRTGSRSWAPYMWLIETSWTNFFIVLFLLCFIINTFFALAFVFIGIEVITHHGPDGFTTDFMNAFFFSIQTFTTVGYGALNPSGVAANTLSSMDALIGLLTFAVATGLFFGRVSQPKAQIVYSDNALIRSFNGCRAFMFRIANQRDHKIVNLKVKAVMSWWDESDESPNRKYYTLPLERDEVALLPLSWTIVSQIDEENPLFEKGLNEIIDLNAEFIIQIEGYDQTFNQMVYSNYSYIARELLWEHQFLPMFFSRDGYTELDLEKLNDNARLDD